MKLFIKVILITVFSTMTISLNAESIEDRLNIVTESDAAANSSSDIRNNNSDNVSSSDMTVQKKGKAEFPAPASEDKILLESAFNYFANGDYAAAIMKIDDLLNTYPASLYLDQAMIIRAKILSKNGDYKGAAAELSKISRESGEYPVSLYLRAEIFRNAKDTNSAREMYLKLASMFPGNDLADDSLLNLGDIYLSDGSSEKALEIAAGLIKNYSDRETVDDAYFLLGKIFMQDKTLRDLQKARQVYKKFIFKAEVEKDPFFAKSPLLNRVKINYNNLNKYYFNEKN